MQDKVMCPYCGKEADLVMGDVIYPHREDLDHKWFYFCKPCDAYVGCHPDTQEPLGSLADSTLRYWRTITHSAFDPLWRTAKNRSKARFEAYLWLAEKLEIQMEQCHIGMFDLETCKKAIEICRKRT